MLVHPDRVPEDEKELATEKFKVLSKLNSVLTDKDKKSQYDETGVIDDDDEDESSMSKWMEMWKAFFKPITTQDIDNYQKEYVGSDLEKMDIKKAYLNGKGCISYMMNAVPFMQVTDEPRIIEYVKELIDEKEVEEFEIFTNEPKEKRNKRHKKYAREAKEAEVIKERISLEQIITKRHSDRASNSDNFFDSLIKKYGGEDNSPEVTFSKKVGKKLKKRAPSKRLSAQINDSDKDETNRVKSGRVTKSKN